MQASNLSWRNKTSQITLKSMLAAGGLLVSGLFLMPHSLNGQDVAGAPEYYQTSPAPHFKPNRGQVADHEGDLIKAYEYVYQAPGMKVGLTQNGFHYNLYTVKEKEKPHKKVSEATGKPVNGEQQKPERPGDEEAEKQTTYHYHRVEVEFKGANEDPEIIAEEKMDYYANYYLGYLPEYVTKVHGYQKLTYKNLYDNIDLVLRPVTTEKGRPRLKYNIRVRPGGDLSDVKLVYRGLDKLSLEDGKLQIATSQGRMTETIPESYWAESKEATTVNYQLEGNTVTFQAEQQQQGQTLVVDPSLNWSTYTGGSDADEGNGVTTDDNRNVYVTGEAESGFPTTSGAYQGSYGGGGGDAFLSKFTSSGSLSWSTYLGGGERDFGYGVTTDGSGNVYVTGDADTTFPTTSGAYQASFGGGDSLSLFNRDAFLSKFTSSGSLSWSTYLGGSNTDLGRGVATNGSGDVYVTGQAFSGFPTTSRAYQTSFGGNYDAFLSKFTSSGSLSWSTYLGGSNPDAGLGVTTDGSGNVYVTGQAQSDFPTTSGAYQQSYGGSGRFRGDVFLSKFTSGGSLSYSTYLGGSNGDEGRGVTTDGSGNVYVTGGAQSGFPTTSGAYQGSYGGRRFRGDAFLSKFTSSGSLSWSTYLGGSKDDEGDGVTTDDNGNVYVTGLAQSGFPTTSGAYQQSYGGGDSDAFLSKFTSSGSLSYSTYLGGGNNDEVRGVTTDGSGNVYVTGFAESGFPTTSGAYQGSSGGNGNAFLSKFDFTTTPNAGFTSDSGCAGKALSFVDTSSLLGSNTINQYNWNFGDGSSDSGQSVSHAYRSAGTYTVELIVTTAEGPKDTATKNAQVYPNPSASFTVSDRVQCQRDSFQFTDQSTISTGSLTSYEWSFGDNTSSQSKNPVYQYSKADSFTVGLSVISDQGCEDATSQQVTVNPNPSASFTVNDRVQCLRDSFQFTNQSTISAGSLAGYKWSFGDGDSSQRQNPSHQYSNADSFTVGLIATSDQGCEDTASQPVTVNPTPNSSFTFRKRSGGTVVFEAADSTLANYQWTFGDSTSSSKADPDHTYTSNGTYKVDLVTTNSTNCRDTTTNTVTVSTVGLEEKPNGPDIPFKAYPNPFSRGVTISYELPAAQSQVTLKVVDEQGKVIIRQEQGRQPAGRHTHQLQALQEASPGTYFIRLKLGGDKQQVERVVKVE